MREIFKNSFGFTMVGALVASSIGAVAVVGLARLSSTIINTLNKSRKETNMMELSQDIKRVFQAGYDPDCNINDPNEKCWNACTSSLIGYSIASGGSMSIKAPDPLPNPSPLPSGISAGSEVYKGGEIYKGIRIQNIQYVPVGIPGRADVTVHFSISDDTRETLTAPRGLEFRIFIDETDDNGTPADLSDDKIARCNVASAAIVGSGAVGVVEDCRKVDGGKTLVGCGGTAEISGSKVTAFGYRAGKDKQNATGGSGDNNSFLGTEAGRKNEGGNRNIFIGYQAGLETKEGRNNLFLGYKAGHNNTKGVFNVVIGNERNVPVGAEERDRLNIADVITGRFINELVAQSSPGTFIYGTIPSLPEILFEKGPVHIEPVEPTRLNTPRLCRYYPYHTYLYPTFWCRHPHPDPPSTPPDKFTLSALDKSKIPVGLHIVGEMHIKKGSDEIKIKAGNLASPAAYNPLAIIEADRMQLKRGATFTAGGSGLSLNRNLKIFGVRQGDGGGEPGLATEGNIQLHSRDPDKTNIQIQAGSSRLTIKGDLTVKGEGGGSKSSISQDLKVDRNLYVEELGTLNFLDLEPYDTSDPANDATADFGTLKVDETATIPQIKIGTAHFGPTTSTTAITGITKASINDLDGGDGHLSHIHPSGNAALNLNRTPNHNHDCQYSPAGGHGHGGCGSLSCGHVNPCPGPPVPDRDCRSVFCSCVCSCPCPCPPCGAPSSRILKRNIKPFKDYEKSLKDIAATPLFTYQYKKDKGEHPEKPRMGIISEELPKDLQIMTTLDSETACETDKKQKDSQAKKKEERKENKKISIPDWLSIYGTLWAGIKAFAKELEDFKKESAVKLTELSKELKTYLTDQMALLKKEISSQLASLEKETAEVEKALEKHSKEVAGATRELSELKEQFKKDLLPLQNSYEEELKKIQEEMDAIKEQLKQNLSFHPAKKSTLEARSR